MSTANATTNPEVCQKSSHRKEQYTCPICMEYLRPPVYQCSNGHLICNICESKVKICPQCFELFPSKKIRNLIVEEIVRKCTYQCKYLEAGCDATLQYETLREHEADCKFSPMNFCECFGISCDYKVGLNGILHHLKNVHAVRGIETSSLNSELVVEIHQTIPKVELDSGKDFMGPPHFFSFDGTVFFLKTLVNVKEKCISWMVCVAGNQKTAEKYQAKIMVFTTVKKNCVEWKGVIYSFDQKFGECLTLSIPFKFLVLQSMPLVKVAEISEVYSVKTRITINIPDPPTVSPYALKLTPWIISLVTSNKSVDQIISPSSNIAKVPEQLPGQNNISEGVREVSSFCSSVTDSPAHHAESSSFQQDSPKIAFVPQRML